ncbi:MAG: hypothetical protein D3904_10710 [Candidatus Electrothrix sp. EH2]|nr:hypothetical protein [Candidatus Electrothrix sp. EH2]
MVTPEFSSLDSDLPVLLYSSEHPDTLADYGIVQSLAEVGINILSPETKSEKIAHIFCVQQITPELYKTVSTVSSKGKVLIILLPGIQASSVEYWQLLQAGAADILHWEHSPQPAKEIAARLARWQEIDHLAVPLSINFVEPRSRLVHPFTGGPFHLGFFPDQKADFTGMDSMHIYIIIGIGPVTAENFIKMYFLIRGHNCRIG